MTGVQPSTQNTIINRWGRHGFHVRRDELPRGPNKMLSYNDRVQIANPQTLLRMRHLSLQQRAHLLKEELNL